MASTQGIDTNLLLRCNVRPGELLLELISLVALFPGLLSLFIAREGFGIRLLEVGDDLGLPLQHLVGLADVLHARLILLAELAELSPLEEELQGQRVSWRTSQLPIDPPYTCRPEKTPTRIACILMSTSTNHEVALAYLAESGRAQ